MSEHEQFPAPYGQAQQAPPPPPPPPGYGFPPPQPQKTNTMAILGLIFAFVASPVGIVLSAIGLKQTKERNEGGHGLALAGLILSIVFTLIWVVVMIFVFAVAGAAVKAANDIDAAASSASEALKSAGVSRPDTTGNPAADHGATTIPSGSRGVLRLRPVLQGPEPATGAAGSATARRSTASAAPGVPVTREEAAADYAALSCRPNRAPDSVDGAHNYVAACSEDGTTKYLLGPAIVDGTDVIDARAATQQTTGEWVVLLNFDNKARSSWADYTAAHVGESVAFTLDGRVISAPFIQGAINGETTITGSFTEASARELARRITGG